MPDRIIMENYAKLIVQAGLNLQAGQKLFIGGGTYQLSPEVSDFVRCIAEKAYEAGAAYVYTYYEDEEQTRLLLQKEAGGDPSQFPVWHGKWMEDVAKEGGAFLTIACPQPGIMDGADPQKLSAWSKVRNHAMDGYRAYTRTARVNWCVAAAATKSWARKLYPDLDAEAGTEKLWRQIFEVSRADKGNAVGNWRAHQEALRHRRDWLNAHRFRSLVYQSSTCDFQIDLPERHIWFSGGMATLSGLPFSPNIPTEEVFTSPLKGGMNGTVSCTLPLVNDGVLIDNFTLTFKEGKIIDYRAETGGEKLQGIIETDEGSHYLGEVALVPADSPLARLRQLFYNTLYDENASCHLAIGSAYPFCLENGSQMNGQEIEANGLNRSAAHVDFMIGSDDLNIDGITDGGGKVPVFRSGNWAADRGGA